MKLKSRGTIITLSTLVALGLVGGGTATAISLDKDTVTLSVDGKQQTVSTRARDVASLLAQQGITVGERDIVQPNPSTRINEGTAVTVQYARPVTLTIDGKKVVRWTTATNLATVLTQLSLDDPKTLLSTNRSSGIGRDGLTVTVTTPRVVTIKTAGGTKQAKVAGNATVEDALKAVGITLDKRDIVTPVRTTPVATVSTITFQDVKERPVLRNVDIPFAQQEKKDATLPKGETKVAQRGVKGVKQNTVVQVYVDGKLVSNHWVKSSKVTRKPVAQVVLVGTKEPEPKPEVDDTSTDTNSSDGNSSSNDSSTTTRKTSTTTKQSTNDDESGTDVSPKSGGVSGACEASNYWDPQPTASGEPFDPSAMTAAHKTLPLGTRLKVTNTATGKSVVVRINDRGPYVGGRCLDLSKGAFLQIAPESAGVAQVTYVQV